MPGSRKTCQRRLADLYLQADEMDHSDGMNAYRRYNEQMQTIAAFFNTPLKQTTAAFVALSPNSDYKGNLRSLISMLEAKRQGFDYEDAIVSTYNACRARAALYLNGVDFLDHAKGLKTRAFYHNILHPLTSSDVTVDGHMYHAWAGTVGGMKDAKVTVRTYRQIRNDIKKVATVYGLRPLEMQAILWFTRKRLLGVVYDSQLSLLERGQGFQRTSFKIEDLKPYGIENDPNKRDTAAGSLRRTPEVRASRDSQGSFCFDPDGSSGEGFG